ncbi:MAG: hypothetical protein M5U16_10870 [Hyphomicrobium sp.]|nr:hypothetical protein [Hyphomicrobium sp.]
MADQKSQPGVNPKDAPDRVTKALESDVPQIYANGFINALSNGDILTVLERNNKPVAVLNLSFTVAKTLGISLSQTVAQFEEATGRNMLTTHEVDAALAQKDAKKAEKK